MKNLKNFITESASLVDTWSGPIISNWLDYHDGDKKFSELQVGDVVYYHSFDKIDKSFSSKEAYIKNFAPQYIELEKALKERENQISVLKQRVKNLEAYSSKVKAFLDAEDADYKEV